MAPHISVILGFKHPLVALGVRSALSRSPDLQVIAECSTFGGTVRTLKKLCPRVLIVGTGLCEGDHGSIETLQAASPDTRIAIYCTHAGDLPDYALLQGARVVLPPEVDTEQFVQAVHAIAAGRVWRVRLKAGQNGARSRTRPHASTHPALRTLTPRERQIAHGIAVGKRNREIAEAYDISPGTVKLHLNKIYAKLGVNSRLALMKKMLGERIPD